MEQPLSVAELTDLIKLTLEKGFQEAVVIGEISNFKAHPSGHYYFSLKDEKACLTSVMFRTDNQRVKFKPQDGHRVVAVGRITVYPPRGNYQLVITRMEPDGVGALQLAFEQLKKKLEAEGFFNLDRKRPIPKFPKTIGIVTSPSGAAIRDILQILDRRFAGLHILIFPVKVQGDGAAEEVAAAIHHFNQHFETVDVLIVGRGGGSMEDLWAFNEEVVARAIFNSRIPIISAVGHEVDFTIADFVADLRAPTPSAAAELVIGNKWETIQHLDHLMKRLGRVQDQLELAGLRLDDLVQRLDRSLRQKISDFRLKVENLRGGLLRYSPTLIMENYRNRVFNQLEILHRAPKAIFERKRWQVEHLQSKLRLLNPRTIMERGYSIVRVLPSRKVVKKAADVRMGDKLLIELAKGKITAKI